MAKHIPEMFGIGGSDIFEKGPNEGHVPSGHLRSAEHRFNPGRLHHRSGSLPIFPHSCLRERDAFKIKGDPGMVSNLFILGEGLAELAKGLVVISGKIGIPAKAGMIGGDR